MLVPDVEGAKFASPIFINPRGTRTPGVVSIQFVTPHGKQEINVRISPNSRATVFVAKNRAMAVVVEEQL